MNLDKLIKNKDKYCSIFDIFLDFFHMKGYKPNSYFDESIWFLKNDNKYQNYIKKNTSKGRQNLNNSKLLDILKEINGNSNDIKNIYIKTEDFVHKISKVIYDSKCSIDVSNENIEKNNCLEKLAKINEILNLLNIRLKRAKNYKNISTLVTKLSSLNNFPSGPYRVSLCINSDLDKYSINELNESEKKNMNKESDNSVFSFLEEKIYDISSLISIPQGKTSINFNNLDEKDNYRFDKFEFGTLDNLGNKYLVDRSYSGSTLSSYKIKIVGPKDQYESSIEFSLHLFVSSIDELCDLNNNNLNKNYTLTMKGQNDIKNKKNSTVGLRIEIELDIRTKISILNRIKNLFSIPIENKVKNQLQIDEILTDYFPELKEKINCILNEKEKEREFCCACNIL